MGKRLYVSNLPHDAAEANLRAAFEQDGRKVERVNIVLDRETGRPRGFAFVEMATEEDAKSAIAALDGAFFGSRNLRVNEAEDRRPGGPGAARGPGPGPRSQAAGPRGGAGPGPMGAGGPRPARPAFGGEGGGERPWSGDDERRRSEKKGGRRKHDSEDDFDGPRRGGRRRHDDDDDDEW